MKPTNKQSVDQMHLIDSKSSVFLHAACVPVSDPSSSTVLYNFCVILFEREKVKQRRAKGLNGPAPLLPSAPRFPYVSRILKA